MMLYNKFILKKTVFYIRYEICEKLYNIFCVIFRFFFHKNGFKVFIKGESCLSPRMKQIFYFFIFYGVITAQNENSLNSLSSSLSLSLSLSL